MTIVVAEEFVVVHVCHEFSGVTAVTRNSVLLVVYVLAGAEPSVLFAPKGRVARGLALLKFTFGEDHGFHSLFVERISLS